jgi:hypothetical protein
LTSKRKACCRTFWGGNRLGGIRLESRSDAERLASDAWNMKVRRMIFGGGKTMRNGESVIFKIQEPIPWIIVEDKECGGYVATSKVLNLTTQGETGTEIVSMIIDVTWLLFDSLAETDELEGFLNEHGLHFSKLPMKHPSNETYASAPRVDAFPRLEFASA